MHPDPDAPRIVALLGAPGSGKSALAEALVGSPLPGSAHGLRHGRVEQPGRAAVHVLDAPGDPELAGAVFAALRAATAAVLVLSPVQGLDPRSVALWEACERAELPLLVAVTQLDRPGADADEAVALSQRLLGAAVLPLQLPLHDDDGLVAGLLDLLALQVVTPHEVRAGDPEHVRLVDPLREELLELVLSGAEDEELFARWADGGEVAVGDLQAELPRAIGRGDLQPLVVVAPGAGVGVPQLRALLASLPVTRPAPPAETPDGDPVHLDVDGPPAAEVLCPGLAVVWSGPGAGELVAVEAEVPGEVVGTALVLAPWDGPPPQFPVGVREDAGLVERVRRDPVARLEHDPRSGQLLLWSAGPGHAELLLQGLPSLPVALEGPRTGTLEVRVPPWCARTVRSDVHDRNGEVLDAREDDDEVVLVVRLPASELAQYSLALTRASAGTGTFARLTGPLSA